MTNLTIITADMVTFEAPEVNYDRIVSIEMFEHMKNYDKLFERCTRWLKSGGLMFIHIFVHKDTPYHFEEESEDDWMSVLLHRRHHAQRPLFCFFTRVCISNNSGG